MEVRAYRDSDSKGISEMMKRCFLNDVENIARSFEPEYYLWKYKKNVFGKPIVWVAEEDGQIISFFAILPRIFWMKDREFFVGHHLDAFMDPRFQGRGIFKKMIENAFRETRVCGMEIIMGTPNKPTVPLWVEKHGFSFCFEYRCLVRPLNFDSIIRTRLPNRTLSKVLGLPLSIFYRMFFRKHIGKKCIKIEKIDGPNGRIDEVWEKNKRGYTFTYVKNSDYLNWRFVENPEDYDFYIIRGRGEPIGYAVVKITEINRFTFAHMVDLMMPANDIESLGTTIDHMCNILKRQEYDFLSCWALKGSRFKSLLKRFGFIERRKEYFFVMRSNKEGVTIPDNINDINLWTFSHGDTDEI